MLLAAFIIVQIIIFTALVMFLRQILTRNVSSATAHLEEMGSEYAKKEEEVNKQLEDAKKQSQDIILNAQKEAREQKEQILKEASEEKEKVLGAAHEKANEIMQQAERSRGALIAEIEKKIQGKGIDKAGEILSQVLPEHVRKDIHQRWLDDLLNSGFEQLDRLHIPKGAQEIKIVSAFELTAKQRDAFLILMKEKLGEHIDLSEETDSDIIAGMVVHIGSLVFDGSLKFRIQEVARAEQSNV